MVQTRCLAFSNTPILLHSNTPKLATFFMGNPIVFCPTSQDQSS